MPMHWFVLHTLSGHEAKVKSHIEGLIEQENLKERIGRVLLPTQEVVQIKKGKKTKQVKKFLPSYILIEMEMDRELQNVLTDVPGVTRFIGSKDGRPEPIREAEIARILGQTEKDKGKEVSEIPFQTGDAVKIKEGPFKDFSGVVEEINPERGRMKVMVSVFGRSTPVELDFVQVVPIS